MTRIGRALIEEGLGKGLEQGRRDTARSKLMQLVAARFAQVPEAVRQRIEATGDVALVDAWITVAIRAQSIADAQRASRPRQPADPLAHTVGGRAHR